MERFCTNCGNTLEEGALFCPECGEKVNIVIPPAQAPDTFAEEVREEFAQASQTAQQKWDNTEQLAKEQAREAAQAAAAAAPVYAAAAPAPAPEPEPFEAASKQEDLSKTVKTSTYFWLSLLFAIPVIGLISLIITACAARNRSIRNFAKSFLVWILVGLVFTLISALALFILSKQMDIDIKSIDFQGIWQGILDGIGL